MPRGLGSKIKILVFCFFAANAEPISHTGILPGGTTQRQQTVQIPTVQIPSSVGTLLSNGTLPFMQNGHQTFATTHSFPMVAPTQFSIVGATDQLSLQPGLQPGTVILQGQPGVQG